jgi:hypothetical protein
LLENSVEANQVRGLDSSTNEILYDLAQIDRGLVRFWVSLNVSALVNLKVASAPAVDAVTLSALSGIP